MGHHFIPRSAGAWPRFSNSRFNVLSPGGITRGNFYERHYKVDRHYYGSKLPAHVGGGSWSGKRLGLEKYGNVGQVWYGSPTELKAIVGAGAVGIGAAGGAAADTAVRYLNGEE